MSKETSKAPDANGISGDTARQAIRTLLQYIGEDHKRDGLLETPDRVCRAFLEMTEGYSQKPEDVLSVTFEGNSEEMVLLKDIDFNSCCEHHMLPFSGKAHVAYIPSGGRIVGLSKLARVVDVFAKRLQVQERMTEQISHAILDCLKPAGVAVVVKGVHSCMCVRGVRKQNGVMITSSVHGVFRTCPETRAEFMSLIRGD